MARVSPNNQKRTSRLYASSSSSSSSSIMDSGNTAASNDQNNMRRFSLEELEQIFKALPNSKARSLQLIEWHNMNLYPILPILLRTSSTKVVGCISVTHIESSLDDTGSVKLRAYSDTKLASGMLAMICMFMDGSPADKVLSFEAADLILKLGLNQSFLTTSRSNGFRNMIELIQRQVRQLVVDKEASEVTFVTATTTRTPMPEESKGPSEAEQLLHDRYSSVQPEEVAVLLSGGVDSSVSLRLLLEQGKKPVPFYLKIWLEDELAHLNECPWEEDVDYASKVCDQAGLKLETLDFQRDYWDEVVSYTISEAKRGRTPNPDVMCNSRVKFGVFYDRIGKYFNNIASGHYAQRDDVAPQGNVEEDEDSVILRRSPDPVKDQTYFLANLRKDQLRNIVFPIGAYTKEQVRALAHQFDLPTQSRKDSQGICFLGKLRFDDFLEHYLGSMPGPFVEYESGIKLGTHRGFWFYTLGQRKGVGLSGGPWFVVSKNVDENIVYLSREYNEKPRDAFQVESINWLGPISMPKPGLKLDLDVKVRHSPELTSCELIFDPMSISKGFVKLAQNAKKGLAPGQFAVFYLGDRCVGSGVICSDFGLSMAPREITGKWAKNLQAHHK